MTKLRSPIAVVSALGGVGIGVLVPSGCGCPARRTMLTGEFTVTATTLNAGAPEGLRDIEVAGLTITDETAVVHYTRAGEAGTATFTFRNH